MIVLQIQSKRVDCFRDLTSLMKSAGTATMESVEASLTVCSAEINVTYLQQEYEKTKGEQESAEVRSLSKVAVYTIIYILYLAVHSIFFV